MSILKRFFPELLVILGVALVLTVLTARHRSIVNNSSEHLTIESNEPEDEKERVDSTSTNEVQKVTVSVDLRKLKVSGW